MVDRQAALHGVGEYAGRMLVVNWGDKFPVVYSSPATS